MNAPRLALLVLWAALAPSLAFAGQEWDPVMENGNAWKAITFRDENGQEKHYWFRGSATGDAISLYTLTPKENSSVSGGTYYESQLSAYTMKLVVTPGGRNSPPRRAYTITRAGTSLALSGTESGTLGASAWDRANPPKYEERRVGRSAPRPVRTNPMPEAGVQVLVAAPGDKTETLAATPMTHYVPGVGPQNWRDYYFEREPAQRARGTDPDASYRAAKPRFSEMHRRILPFEVILSPDSCYVVPERCADASKPEYAKYITAGNEAAKGNIIPTESLATAAHAEFIGKARAFRATLSGGPETEFTREETALLQRLLANTNKTPQFQSELATVRGKDDQMKLFVKKWRGYLASEIDVYLGEAAAAGNKKIDFAKARTDLFARAQKNVETPLTPAAPARDNRPAGSAGRTPAFPSALNKATPAFEWYVYENQPRVKVLGPVLAFNLGPAGPPVYCRLGPVGVVTIAFIPAHANKTFECVTLKAPVPPHKNGELKAQVDVIGTAAFDSAVGIDPLQATLTFKRSGPSLTEAVLSKPRQLGAAAIPMAGIVSFHPTTTPDLPAQAVTPGASVAAAIPLSDKEKRWLTKQQQLDFAAADKAKQAREAILVNLKPNAAAITAYQTAIGKADAKAKDLDDALPAKTWGEGNTTIVGLSGPNAEIQLNAEELKKLEAKPEALSAYRRVILAHGGSNSPTGGGEFTAARYDPIALHNAVMAAREAIGGAAPSTGGTPAERAPNLTAEQMKLLTPEELSKYLLQLKAANATPPNQSALDELSKLSKQYADLIASEKRAPYAAPKDLKEFEALKTWQKAQFCKPGSNGTLTAPAGTGTSDPGKPKALPDLIDIAGQLESSGGGITEENKSWSNDACARYKEQAALASGQDNPGGRRTNTGDDPPVPNVTHGPDKELEAKKPNKWLTQDLLTSGAKGAMIGLLIGSLFGPVGLIVGPIAGGAMFYGLTKLTSKD